MRNSEVDVSELKPTKRLMELCEEMFERKVNYGKDYPLCWREKSIKKMMEVGLVQNASTGCCYFTEVGLEWYLANR